MLIKQLLDKYPFVIDFFNQYQMEFNDYNIDINQYIDSLTYDYLETYSITKQELKQYLKDYIVNMNEFLNNIVVEKIESLTILPGLNKNKETENYENLVLKPSDLIAIVGSTGSGKSRLLADIEYLANKDSITNRQILINNELPNPKLRFNIHNKLVAQLSQNMNFVIDITVYEFLKLHAESRNINNPKLLDKIIKQANNLAGEPFDANTPVTSLSGGQSRALMISDTALLSPSPIVLIDEIENAGINKLKALELLRSNDKIVLMATHDPILCLSADSRIVIQNGGISSIIKTSEQEKLLLNELMIQDAYITNLRTKIRQGESLTKAN